MRLTRRTFLELVGRAGGAGAVYGAMGALGLLETSASARAPFHLTGSGKGRKVLILGAGLAGMNAAYELGKRGYDCKILEARHRSGGRCHTIKRGQIETETDGRTQTCRFDDGLYLNPGPARIPQHHVTLDYCRELNVPVEMFNNVNESAYLYVERPDVGTLSGKRIRMREARADLNGYCAELLAKAIHAHTLDSHLDAEDAEKLVAYLRETGGLNEDLFYKGGDRRGYTTNPGAALTSGVPTVPYDLKAVIEAGFGGFLDFASELDQQATMFQIVGGTHGIAKAFEKRVGHQITFGAAVQEIRQTPTGVTALYKDKAGQHKTATGEFCVCAIPLSVLRSIPSNFAAPVQAAISSVEYARTGKIGLQFQRRFWEEDDRIYSGISHTNLPITQIMYPATGYFGRKGVLVGYYNFEEDAALFGALPPDERTKLALTQGAKIHPQYPREFDNHAFSVAWHKVPYTLGGWAGWDRDGRTAAYETLTRPDGRVYFAGEHMSYLTGWMAGALESARAAVTAIHARASQEAHA